MKKDRRYIRNIVILACVCAGLATAYFVITANEDPATAGVLYRLGTDKIAQVEIDNRYGNFVFKQQEGGWIVESNGVYRTNPEKILLLLASLEKFEITRMLPEEKNEYGFSDPEANICVSTARGKKYSFKVGNEAIAGSSVYIKSGSQIMLTSTSMTAQLTGSLAAYRAKDVLLVDPANIRSIEYYEDGKKVLSVANSDYKNWTMVYPYDVPARKVVLNELVANLSSLTIAGYVDSENTGEETGINDMSAKMVLTDEAGVQQTLKFGAIEDTMQYTSIGTEEDVVQLYTSDLDFSKLNPQSVMYIAPLDIDIAMVQEVSIQANGSTDKFLLEHNGEETVVKLNGNPISYSSMFTPVYMKCVTLNADGYSAESAEPGQCEAEITFTLSDGETIALSLYTRDAETLYMAVNGQMAAEGQTKFYMDKSSLTELLYRIQSVKGN